MAVTGYLGEGNPIVLENAAEEATLQRLVDLFENKFADNSGVKKQEAQAIKEATKQTKSYQDIVNSTTRGMERYEIAQKSLGERINSAGDKISAASSSLESSFKRLDADGAGLGSALTSVSGPASSSIKKMGTAGAIAGASLNALSFVVGAALGAFDNTVKSFYQLTQSGATFGGDLIRMRTAAGEGAMTLSQFTTAVAKNSRGLSQFGGGTTEGAMALSAVTKSARQNQRELTRLGISYKDTPEFLAGFMSDLSASGFSLRDFGGDFSRVAKVAVGYRKSLQELSEITGKSVEEQEAARKQLETDAAFQAILADMAPEQAASMKALMESMSPLEQEMIKQKMTLGTLVGETAIAGSQFAGVTGRVDDVVGALQRGETDLNAVYARSSTQRAGQLDQDAATAREYAKMSAYTSNLLTKVGAENAIALSKQAEQNAAAAGNLEEVRKQQNVQKELTDAITRREAAMGKINQAFERLGTALVDSGIIGVIVGGMEILADTISGLSNLLGNNLISALVVGITGLFAMGAAKAAITSGIGLITEKFNSSISKMFSAGPAGTGAGAMGKMSQVTPSNAGKGFGTALGNIGKGLGKGIAGVLKGLAAGLSAFARPQILLGAAILAGAILIIGAAIAGAAWIMGKALPTFIEGFMGFTEIDGDALGKTAKGMLLMSLALAAFGAGTAVAGLGSLVGGIAGGLGKLFGAEDPMDKLVRFASYDIDVDRVKGNATAMVAYSKAMAAAGGANATQGLGALVSGITGGISRLFGGDSTTDMMEKLKKFASYDIDPSRVENNARAMVAYSKAMAAFGSAQAAEGLGSLVSGIAKGIASLFGGGTDPIEEVERFSQARIDADSLKTKAEAISDMMNVFARVGTLADTDFAYIDNMTDAIYKLADAVDDLNTRKIEALAEFTSANAGVTAGGGATTVAGAAQGVAGSTTVLEDLTRQNGILMQKLIEVQTRQGSEQTDYLRKISNDF
jgi:tRNA threonylcarbamoyladenosine modification (KEOPS) complex Cgi121 subunit